MFNKQFGEINKTDVDTLVASQIAESKTIEFKRDLPDNSKEFLADVSSFANAAGGDIVFGIDAPQGTAVAAAGIMTTNIDADILRLENLIRDGIEPRLPVQTKHIDGFGNGPIVLMRIPKSWSSPHMVTLGGTSRFFTRASNGKHQMDVGEIRNAFAISDSIGEKIRRFHLDRVGKIIAQELPVRLRDQPKIILHLIPFSAFGLEPQLSPGKLYEGRVAFKPIRFNSDLSRINIDGLLSAAMENRQTGTCFGHCQVFRSGIVEAVDASIIERNQLIPSWALEDEIIKATDSYLKGMADQLIVSPLVAMLTVTGASGLIMAPPPRRMRFESTPIDRDILIMPDVIINDMSKSPHSLLRPLFDAIWNAAGWPESPYYDADGARSGS